MLIHLKDRKSSWLPWRKWKERNPVSS